MAASDVTSNKLAINLSLSPAVIILFLMILGGAISWLFFIPLSIRLDEAQSLVQTSMTLPGLVKFVATDVHVPLYYIIIYPWQRIFGNDILIVRLVSTVLFVLTIPAVYALGKAALKDNKQALLASLLITISPFMLWYSAEARMYAMLALVAVMSNYFYLRILDNKLHGTWFWYTLSAVVGAFTHYFFIFVLLTQAVFFFIRQKSFPKGSLPRFSGVATLLLATFGPWLYYVYTLGFASTTQPNLTTPTSVDLFNTLAQFIFGFQVDSVNTIIVSFWPLLVLFAFLGIQKRAELPRTVQYLLFATFMPMAIAFGISLAIQPFYLSRYLIVSLPPALMVIIWVFSTYPRSLARSLKTLLVIGVVIALTFQINSDSTPLQENYRAATNYLEANTSPQDIIIVSAPFTVYPVDYTYGGDTNVQTLPIWNRFDGDPQPPFVEADLPAEVAVLAGDHQKAYVLLSFDQGYETTVRDYFEDNFQRLDMQTFSPDLELYVYQLRYDPGLDLTKLNTGRR